MLSGCTFFKTSSTRKIVPENDNKREVVTRNIPFKNLTNEYSIPDKNIALYFPDNGSVPYLNVMGFIKSLDGFFDCGDNLRYEYYPQSNFLGLYYYSKNQNQSYIQLQWDNNRIWVSNMSFFYSITKPTRDTNYSSYINSVDYYSSGSNSVSFELGDYGFDVLYYQQKCLVPLTIFNLLFCSRNQYNIFYNGDCLYGYYGEISKYDEAYRTIHQSSLNGQSCPKDMREATINGLLFTLDYFYGLKKEKNIKSFNSYIRDEDFDLLWSEDPEDNLKGYKHILLSQLDELHTRIDSSSFYSSSDFSYSLDECGEFRKKFYSLESQQSLLKKQTFPNGIEPVRFCKDTAIITFDEFLTGSDSQLRDSMGYLKDTAWKYDTYYFMQHCMKKIQSHTGINDILIDLSLNGGGNLGAMQRCLGFLTDNVIKRSTYDSLTKEFTTQYYKVDTDGDGYYDDDAYSQYRWTILSSLNTFSAANEMTSDAKHQGMAKVIGQRSGGGMCPVRSTVLCDGTAITISSEKTIRYVKKENGENIYYSVETGIKPDLEVLYSDFYNDEKLVEFIDEVWNANPV